ncbi:hypothetical protein V5799_020925 [Amblyomma americanum]|uniref:Lipocal-1 1 n=1 Tax=Amblyomma americanum TaxID=6943 RepID=A0AAQ4ESG4_AMBAM
MKKQMGMIFLLTFVLLESLLCRASTEDSPPIWANETRLGKYQDPWKILNQSRSEVYYLVNSTFSSADYLWGSNFTCVSVRFSNTSAEWRKSEFKYRNASSGNDTTWASRSLKADVRIQRMQPLRLKLDLNTTVSKTYNYTQPNAIQYMLHNCSLLNDTVIFTDGNACNLLSIPYENNGKGCELWVKEDYLRNKSTPLCCYFLFDLLCAQEGSYTPYNDDCLNSNNSLAQKS